MDGDKYHRGFLGNTSFASRMLIIEFKYSAINKGKSLENRNRATRSFDGAISRGNRNSLPSVVTLATLRIDDRTPSFSDTPR